MSKDISFRPPGRELLPHEDDSTYRDPSDFEHRPVSLVRFETISHAIFPEPMALEHLAQSHNVDIERTKKMFQEQFEHVVMRSLHPWKKLGISVSIEEGEILLTPNTALAQELLQQVFHTLIDAIIQESKAALKRTEVYILLEKKAHTDELTGLGNKAGLTEVLETMEAQRHNLSIKRAVFIHIDLDNFKKINDVHGHQTGDVVLQQAAARLMAAVRADDVAVRLGGEELGVLMVNVPTTDIPHIAEKIKEAMTFTYTQPEQADVFVTASIGIADAPITPKQSIQTVVTDLIVAADTATLRAKALGKNRVVLASEQENKIPYKLDPFNAFLGKQKQETSYERTRKELSEQGQLELDIAVLARAVQEYEQHITNVQELVTQHTHLTQPEKTAHHKDVVAAKLTLEAERAKLKQYIKKYQLLSEGSSQ